MSVEASFLGKTWALTRKDIRIELRGRDTLPPMLAFSVAVALLFAFSLPGNARVGADVTTPFGTVQVVDAIAGFLWVTVLFAGLIGFARTFDVERSLGALDAMLLIPLDRAGLFLSKAIANLAFVIVVQILVTPLVALFFGIDLGSRWLLFAAVALLADIGFVAIGTLFATLAAQTRSRELILPILALPALVPVFIAATELTSELFTGGGWAELTERGWFGILIAYDLIFVTAGVLAVDLTLE